MENKLCDIRYERLDEKLETQEKRINNHSERLEKIELVNGKLEERLDNLITQLATLNLTMRWFIGSLVSAFIGFFFYIIQQGVFR